MAGAVIALAAVYVAYGVLDLDDDVWTPRRIGLVVILGVLVIALIVHLIQRKRRS